MLWYFFYFCFVSIFSQLVKFITVTWLKPLIQKIIIIDRIRHNIAVSLMIFSTLWHCISNLSYYFSIGVRSGYKIGMNSILSKGLYFTQFDKNTYSHNLIMRKLAQSQLITSAYLRQYKYVKQLVIPQVVVL